MKCSSHPNSEATAICIQCGRALCTSCHTKSPSGRIVCSAACITGLQITEQAINSIHTKTVSGARSSGYSMLAVAVVFAVFAFVPLHGHIVWYLSSFLLLVALLFFIWGAAFLRIAKRQKPQTNDA